MKVEIEKEEKVFEPFTLPIKVETEDDLKTLFHLFNVSDNLFYSICVSDNVKKPSELKIQLVWMAIRDKCKELGIYKND